MFDIGLLRELEVMAGLTKNAYTPPPPFMNQAAMPEAQQAPGMGMPGMGMPPGGPGMGMPQEDPTMMVQQAVQQGMAEGVPPEQIKSDLAASGIPPEIIDQVLGQQAPSPPPMPQQEQEPLDVRELIKEELENERQKAAITPEERLLMHDKQIEILTKLVQQLVDTVGMTKQSCDQEMYRAYLDAIRYQ